LSIFDVSPLVTEVFSDNALPVQEIVISVASEHPTVSNAYNSCAPASSAWAMPSSKARAALKWLSADEQT
ncbi:MAG: hypothetical protein ACKPKO_32560, partial [Candidatus Fonsibacter sp.]